MFKRLEVKSNYSNKKKIKNTMNVLHSINFRLATMFPVSFKLQFVFFKIRSIILNISCLLFMFYLFLFIYFQSSRILESQIGRKVLSWLLLFLYLLEVFGLHKLTEAFVLGLEKNLAYQSHGILSDKAFNPNNSNGMSSYYGIQK